MMKLPCDGDLCMERLKGKGLKLMVIIYSEHEMQDQSIEYVFNLDHILSSPGYLVELKDLVLLDREIDQAVRIEFYLDTGMA